MIFFGKRNYRDARFTLHERCALEKDLEGHTPLKEMADYSEYPWDTPTVFCLGGFGATTDQAANGFAKIAQSWLGDDLIKEKEVRLFVAKYPSEDMKAAKTDLMDSSTANNESAENPRRILGKTFAKQLVDGMFKPCIDAALRQGKEEAKATLAKHFSHITFLGYSIGSYFLPHVHEALKQALIEKDFSPEETSQLMRNIHVLTFGESGVWHTHPREGWDFTSVHMASSKDHIVSKGLNLDNGAEHFITIKNKPHTGVILNTLENPSTLARIAKRRPDEVSHDPEIYKRLRPSAVPQKNGRNRNGNGKVEPENGVDAERNGESQSEYESITGAGAGGLFAPVLLETVMRNMVTRESNKSAIELLAGREKNNGELTLSASHYYHDRLAGSLNEPSAQITLDAWPDEWQIINNSIAPSASK